MPFHAMKGKQERVTKTVEISAEGYKRKYLERLPILPQTRIVYIERSEVELQQ